MLGGIGIILGLLVLLVGCWKKLSIIGVTMAAAAVIGVTNGQTVIQVWSESYVKGISSIVTAYFLIMITAGLFAKLMEDSGSGNAIANFLTEKLGGGLSLAAIVLITCVLCIAGSNMCFIIVLPIAKSIFEKKNYPWYVVPALIYVAMVPPSVGIPGSVMIQNVIPTKFLGTQLTSGGFYGLTTTVFYLAICGVYLSWVIKKGRQNPEADGYKAVLFGLPSVGNVEELPKLISAVIPILVSLGSINIFKVDIVYGLLLGSALCVILCWKQLKPNFISTFTAGFSNGINPMILTGVVYAIGVVVIATPTFAAVKDWMLTVPLNGLFKIFFVSNVIAFFTGNGVSAIATTFGMFTQDFLAMGYAPEALHRFVLFSVAGLDSMPWNAFIVLILSLCGLTYKNSYKYMFWTTVVFPMVSALFLGILITLMG